MTNQNEKTLFSRVTGIQYIEDGMDNNNLTYTIFVKVAYFEDEAMTEKKFEEDMTFEKIPYNPSWDGALTTIYSLINS